MGNLCCGKNRNQKKITLLLLGLDNAGKTVAAKSLAGEPPDTVVPTVGFSVLNLNYEKYKVILFDLGGSSDIRGIWDEYFVYAHGVIFVVDSSDYTRLDEAREVLRDLLSHKKITGKPVLLLANKQDDENALDEIDLVDKLQLETLVNNNQCPTLVETCCASESLNKSTLDPGIKSGYRWLMNYIVRDFETLNKRVEIDVVEQEEVQRKARLETIERIRILNEEEKNCQKNDDVIELYSEYEKQNGVRQVGNGILEVEHREGSDSSSAGSNESIPHIYHIKSENKEERPKSAVQMIKEQIEREHSAKRKKSLKAFVSNKTEPVSLYGVKLPHSASERRASLANSRRVLKSAGDSIFIVSDALNTLPTTNVNGRGFRREGLPLHSFEAKKAKLPPLKIQSSQGYQNGNVVRHSSGQTNGISIVEVD